MADYPTEEELEKIRNWKFGDYKALMGYIHTIWQHADYGFWREKGRTYRIATAGWSGNEDIIRAMRDNIAFWMQCWEESKRGGLHVFKLPQRKKS